MYELPPLPAKKKQKAPYRNGKFTRSTARRGLPDVLVTLKGQSLFIEIKTKRDKMSEFQEAVRDDQMQAGGLYYTAHNFTDFKTWFDAFAVRTTPQNISEKPDNQDVKSNAVPHLYKNGL